MDSRVVDVQELTEKLNEYQMEYIDAVGYLQLSVSLDCCAYVIPIMEYSIHFSTYNFIRKKANEFIRDLRIENLTNG